LSNYDFVKLTLRLIGGLSSFIWPNSRILIENPLNGKASQKNGFTKGTIYFTNSKFYRRMPP